MGSGSSTLGTRDLLGSGGGRNCPSPGGEEPVTPSPTIGFFRVGWFGGFQGLNSAGLAAAFTAGSLLSKPELAVEPDDEPGDELGRHLEPLHSAEIPAETLRRVFGAQVQEAAMAAERAGGDLLGFRVAWFLRGNLLGFRVECFLRGGSFRRVQGRVHSEGGGFLGFRVESFLRGKTL